MGYEKGEVVELDNGEKFQVIEKVDRKILTRKLYTKDFSIYYVSSGPKGYETFAKCDFSDDEKLLTEFMNKLRGSNKDVEKLAFRIIGEVLKEKNKKEKPTNEVAQLIEKYSKPKKDNKQTLKEEKKANKNIIKNDNPEKVEKEIISKKIVEKKTVNEKKDKNIVKESAPTVREYYKLKLNNGNVERGRYLEIVDSGFINVLPYNSDTSYSSKIIEKDILKYNKKSYVYAYKEGNYFRDIILDEKIVIDKEGINTLISSFGYDKADIETLRKAVYPYLSCFQYSVCSNVEVLDFLKQVENNPIIIEKYKLELEKAKEKKAAKDNLIKRDTNAEQIKTREEFARNEIDKFIRNRKL